MNTRNYWNRIRKNYPKAFKKLTNAHKTIEAWGTVDSPLIWGGYVDEEQFQLRHLFDFFDSNKIHIWNYTSNGKEWHYAILTKGRYMTSSKKKYKSRELSEFDAWEKSFELING